MAPGRLRNYYHADSVKKQQETGTFAGTGQNREILICMDCRGGSDRFVSDSVLRVYLESEYRVTDTFEV
jgi:hypothetical protein